MFPYIFRNITSSVKVKCTLQNPTNKFAMTKNFYSREIVGKYNFTSLRILLFRGHLNFRAYWNTPFHLNVQCFNVHKNILMHLQTNSNQLFYLGFISFLFFNHKSNVAKVVKLKKEERHLNFTLTFRVTFAFLFLV